MKIKLLTSIIVTVLLFQNTAFSQGFDSTQIGKEYPYTFPILGKKAYAKGYKLPKPHGLMLNYINTQQDIVLENFEMGFSNPSSPNFTDDDYIDFSKIINFGPSNVVINTLNFRVDTWILPFLSIGGYYGQYTGQTTVNLNSPIELTAVSDADGAYWGANVLVAVPVGPVNLVADYSASFSQNELLTKPVKVNVAGLRVIKNIPIKGKEDMFVGFWGGVQLQFLAAKTEGSIELKEVIDSDGTFEDDLNTWYEGLTAGEKLTYGNRLYDSLGNLVNTTVHYRFDKRLAKNWNYLIGGQWQINRTWQFRSELSFIKGKRQFMASLNYRFGI